MSIEGRVSETETTKTEKVPTPETISVSMIVEDLENGLGRTEIKNKYGLEAWEVKQMFQHPSLKGKKAKKVKKLSFNFLDDSSDPEPMDNVNSIEGTEGGHQMGQEEADEFSNY